MISYVIWNFCPYLLCYVAGEKGGIYKSNKKLRPWKLF